MYTYITLFTARSRIFLPSATLRVALSWPPRNPTIFARLATSLAIKKSQKVRVYGKRSHTLQHVIPEGYSGFQVRESEGLKEFFGFEFFIRFWEIWQVFFWVA